MVCPQELTVLIPTWNRVDRLGTTLPRLLALTSADVDFLIVDNASSDDTWEFLTEAKKSDSRLTIFRQDKNVGGILNIVSGIKRTRTPYVCIVSDDDLVYGPYIDCVLQVLSERPNVGVVHHDFGSVEQRRPCSFAHYPHSPRAGYEAFRSAGSISGLTLNVAALVDSPSWTKGLSRTLYPQLEWALGLALEHGYAHLRGTGFRPGPWPEAPIEIKNRQGRPPDLGLSERVDISLGIPGPLLRARAINNLALWSRGFMQQLKEDPTTEAREAHEAITDLLQPLTPLVGLPVNSLALETLPVKAACTLDVGRRLIAKTGQWFCR